MTTFIISSTSAGGGERLVDPEGMHRGEHREQLADPAEELEESRRSWPAIGSRMTRALRGPARVARAPCRARPRARAPCPLAPTTAKAKSASPTPSTTTSVISAQWGSFAAKQHPDDERRPSGRGRTSGARRRCRSASPRCPRRPGMRRASTATRPSSPTRPGSTAFAKSPTQKAEKTSLNAGRGRADRLADHGVPGERPDDHRDAG